MNKQYKNIVLSGLQRLITLRLKGHPPVETIRAVGEVWLDALYSCGDWNDQRHLNGLIEAFKTAEAECDHFPSPAEIRRRKPVVVNVAKGLPKPPKTPEERRRIDQIIKDIFKNLNVGKEG